MIRQNIHKWHMLRYPFNLRNMSAQNQTYDQDVISPVTFTIKPSSVGSISFESAWGGGFFFLFFTHFFIFRLFFFGFFSVSG